jgi:O-antigen/teichoic acid export membrane protein
MQLKKAIRLYWTFYKSFFISSLLITIICLQLIWKYGIGVYFGVFWLKVISFVFIFYFINTYKKGEFYYYQNLKISKLSLWAYTLTFDFLLFLFLLFQINNFR